MTHIAPESAKPASGKRVAMIGGGRLAEAVCWLMADQPDGWCLEQVYSRRHARGEVLATLAGAHQADRLEALMSPPPDVLLLAVNDDAIGALAAELAKVTRVAADGAACVLHFSGSREAAVLAPLQDSGWSAACLHPARSFADPCAAAAAFAGTVCALEGDEAAMAIAEALVRAWGGNPICLDVSAKKLYHAASVMANNLVVALLDATRAVAGEAGLDDQQCKSLLQPLAEQAVGNYFHRGAIGALTGPLSRGDGQVVASHIQAIEDQDRQLAEVYRLLSRQALDIVRRQDNLQQGVLEQLHRVLYR